MINVNNISYAYPGQDKALDDVSFALNQGQTLGLVGANGSGKSTLLSLLAGLYEPTGGSLSVDGCKSPGKLKRIRRRAGLVMQDADLQIIGSTVREDLCLGAEANGKEIPTDLASLADSYGLTDLLDRAVHELSWGQKKRLCLAATLYHNPAVLLLDEPFAGLDYPGIKQMRDTLAQNRRNGLTQIVAAHDLEPLADLVDTWVVLRGGSLVLAGPGESVFDQLSDCNVRPPCSWQAGLGIQPWK